MSALASLEKTFHGDIVTPTSPDYEDSIKRWASNAQRRAAIVAFVKDADDVRAALLYAQAQGLRIAVRGGGHNPSGSSSIEGGLVIDLSRYLRAVRVDPEAKLAYVDGGALWADVNSAAAKCGLATPGGTVSHTGCGGLTLGGGFGYLMGQHGLVIDNLVQVTIVLASGEKLIASAKENTDIFWAVRGGGSNYGVVTEFVYQLHDQAPNVFAGMLVLAPDALEDVMRILEGAWEKGFSEKETTHVAITLGPGGAPAVILILFWNGSEEEGRLHFKSFFDLKYVLADMCKAMPYEVVNTLQDAMVPHGSCYYQRSVSYPRPSPAIACAVRDAVFAISKENPDISITYIFEHWSTTKMLKVPQSATAFFRSAALSSVVSARYENDTPEVLERARAATNKLTDIVAGAGGQANVGYANYNSDVPNHFAPNADLVLSQAQTKWLFGDNIERLQQIKKKHDPNMVFAKWFAITPKA